MWKYRRGDGCGQEQQVLGKQADSDAVAKGIF
jgi:hypothetical protein